VTGQHTGTAEWIESAQVAVYLTYASDMGTAASIRAVYLPQSWTGDPLRAGRRPDAGRLRDQGAAPQQMIERAPDAEAPIAWATGGDAWRIRYSSSTRWRDDDGGGVSRSATLLPDTSCRCGLAVLLSGAYAQPCLARGVNAVRP
jgi:hypothetical protein